MGQKVKFFFKQVSIAPMGQGVGEREGDTAGIRGPDGLRGKKKIKAGIRGPDGQI